MNTSTEMQGTRSGTTAMFVFGAAVGAVLTALVLWYVAGARDFFHALEESRMAQLALVIEKKTLTPQLREYLKGRLYWNAVVWIPRGWFSGMDIDHGPIDEETLGTIVIAKDGTSPDYVYRAAMKKHSTGN